MIRWVATKKSCDCAYKNDEEIVWNVLHGNMDGYSELDNCTDILKRKDFFDYAVINGVINGWSGSIIIEQRWHWSFKSYLFYLEHGSLEGYSV